MPKLSHEELLAYTKYVQARFFALLNMVFGSSSERFFDEAEEETDKNQSEESSEEEGESEESDSLNESSVEENSSDESEESGSSDDFKNRENKKKKKKRGKRKPLPKDLIRRVHFIKLSEEEKICPIHGTKRIVVGQKVLNETLEYVPAYFYAKVNVAETCKCEQCEKETNNAAIVQAKQDETIIPKSFASPSLITEIIANKYIYGMPLYRQELMFQHLGIELNRSTLARWVVKVGRDCQPLINLMREEALESSVIHIDETTLQVLKEENRTASQKSYMWVMKTASGPAIILFQYEPTRSGGVLIESLDGYQGVIVADAYSAYSSAQKKLSFTLAACMAHVRRKFFEAEQYAKAAKIKDGRIQSSQFLKWIRALYKIERDLKETNADLETILKVRTEKSEPILKAMKTKMDELVGQVLPSSPFGKALSYTLKIWPNVIQFSKNPQIPIDNNPAENAIRPFVVGRKNWLFSDTPQGADASANLYSLVESAKANGIIPQTYLQHLFLKLPQAKTIEDYEKLMPHRCLFLRKPESG